MAIYCPNCGVELPDGVAFCDACGTPLRGQNPQQGFAASPASSVPQAPAQQSSLGAVACPVCGAAALPGEAFCDNCGTSLLGPASNTSSSSPPQIQPSSQPQYSSPPSYSSAPISPSAGSYSSGSPATASLIVTSPPPPATIPMPNRPEMIVGRSDPQSNSYPDVDLNPYGGLELGVSRRHFRLKREGDQVYVEDLNSMNGVVVNGHKIPPYTLHPLRSGDRINLGKMELRFDLS